MKRLLSKILFAIFAAAALFPVAGTRVAYALDCPVPTDVAPDLIQILCPAKAALNIALLSSGAIFSGIILLAAIKYALSQGDPKAVMGAQQTATYAVMGLIAVAGVFVAGVVVANILGLNPLEFDPNKPFEWIDFNLDTFLTNILTTR